MDLFVLPVCTMKFTRLEAELVYIGRLFVIYFHFSIHMDERSLIHAHKRELTKISEKERNRNGYDTNKQKSNDVNMAYAVYVH